MMILLVSKILLGYEVVLWSKKIGYKSCQILTRYLITTVTRSVEMIKHLYKYFWVFNINFETPS